ncbi:Oidioi.mRNA.OKI2018_I69.PAR.g9467.t1.cds [Oikopleura dioica]|uniref:Oidioi.mRNA.OKI2018_I69.PAR.g9467.t1.cds n=1 Tax=Oikopleura dioica TaxID=34765 RepID=A0ABN7RNI8_OIKDI|nr:Oidioi.mRNA.OKI2018_I69.PAR.g9467.t1.cds [Oikopleura dioica]
MSYSLRLEMILVRVSRSITILEQINQQENKALSSSSLNNGELRSECNPESDPENCRSTSPRISYLVLNVIAKEKVPEDFRNGCSENQPCKGMPACAFRENYYMQEQSYDIIVIVQDINNNPPRFFNGQTKKFQAGTGQLKCSSCSEYGKIEEEYAVGTVFTAYSSGNDPQKIIVTDIDEEENNRKFTLFIDRFKCSKNGESVNCAGIFSMNGDSIYSAELNSIEIIAKNTVKFSEIDTVRLDIDACDIGPMMDGAPQCSTLIVNLEITEKTKAIDNFGNLDKNHEDSYEKSSLKSLKNNEKLGNRNCGLPTDNCASFFQASNGNTRQYSQIGQKNPKIDYIYQHTEKTNFDGYTSFGFNLPAGICFPEICDETNDERQEHCLSIEIWTPNGGEINTAQGWSLDQSLTSLFEPTLVENIDISQVVTKRIYFNLKNEINDDTSQSGALIKPIEPTKVKIRAAYHCLNQAPQVDSLQAGIGNAQDFAIYPSNLDPPSFDDVSEFQVTECPVINGKLDHLSSCSDPDVTEYCNFSTAKTLNGQITIKEFRNLFPNNPEECQPDHCTRPTDIAFSDSSDDSYVLTTSPCDDSSDIFCKKASASQTEPADYESKPFYNYQLFAENEGPWRSSNGTRKNYASNARFMVEVLDAPDQAPRFNVPPAMVYFKEGKYRTEESLNYITEDRDSSEKLLISASDPDLDLKWEVRIELSELKTTAGDDFSTSFEIDYGTAADDQPAGPESAVFIKLKNNGEFNAECDPEADPGNCRSNSTRVSNLILNVIAKEKVPADFRNGCSQNEPCKGMPSCAFNEDYYMQEQSFDITVFIQDINNNPPRFFNGQTRKFEAGPGQLKCSYCSEFGKLEEKNAVGTVLTAYSNGNDPHRIIITDIDERDDNRKFKLSIDKTSCSKSDNSVSCANKFSVDTETVFNAQLDPLEVTVEEALAFSEIDTVMLDIKACDEGTMIDGASKCSIFTVNLEITEKNKAPSVLDGDGAMFEYDSSGDYFVKTIENEKPGSQNLQLTFTNQNSVQFRHVFFCDIKNSDNAVGIFEVVNGDKKGTSWEDFGTDYLKEEGSLSLQIRLREGEQLNRQEAKSYIYTVRACSLDGDADRNTVEQCCVPAGSDTRVSSRLSIVIFDSNINAPLFQIYNGLEGSPAYTLPAGSWNVKDGSNGQSPKVFDLSQIQDDDDDYLNTRTCFRIKTSNSSLLDAAEFFQIDAISITKKTFKSQIKMKSTAKFIDADGVSKIKNNQEMMDGQFHFNFEFTVQACNIDCSNGNCEDSDKTNAFQCPADLDEATAICSDTEQSNDNSLISDPTGNTMIRFAIQDENEHSPEIFIPKDNEGDPMIMEIYEKIEDTIQPIDIRTLDKDRCYFNYGRIRFSTPQESPFSVEGGDVFNPDEDKDDHLDKEVFYDLVIRATDGGQPGGQSEEIVKVLVKDINDHGPTFADLDEKDRQLTIKEGTGFDAQSFCGAIDKDSRKWSADVNKYTVQNVKGFYEDVQKCGPGLAEEVSCDNIFSVTDKADKPPTGCSDWVAGRIEMGITAEYIPGTNEKGLNREEYDKFTLEIDVYDDECNLLDDFSKCTVEFCHDQCDGVLDENQRLLLTVNVEDVNDNGPLIAPFKTAHYVLAGTTEAGKDITPQIEVSDADGDETNRRSRIKKISETYICGSSASQCQNNKDFFQVTADPEDPMKFNLKTLKQIPDIKSNNFFAVATITVEVANEAPLYENYDCAYVEKYPDFFKSKCKVENGQSVIYNSLPIVVTVLDEEHVGLVTSTKEDDWDNEALTNKFKGEMNDLFESILPRKNACDCYYDYSTELYKVETQNRPDPLAPEDDPKVEYYTEINFYVVKSSNQSKSCSVPISSCNFTDSLRAGEENRDLLTSFDIAFVLNDVEAHNTLKAEPYNIRVSCNMQKLEECEEVIEEDKWGDKEWLILVIAIGGGLSVLCAGIIVCMCCMRKRYARKLQSERAMKYDMDDMSSKGAYNESQAYQASGEQHKNQLVGQEGMINIALEYDDEDQQSSFGSSDGRASFNSDFDIEEHLNEPKEIYVDSDAEDAKGPNLNALIAGQSSAMSANPLAGQDLDNVSYENF